MNRIPVQLLCYALAGLLGIAAFAHFRSPEVFVPLVPEFIPNAPFWILLSGIVEAVLALGLLYPPARKMAALLTLAMLFAYLPLHVLDLFRETPAVGSMTVAIIRIPVQFLFMWAGWRIYKLS